jgi:hypothetical protein
MASKMEEEVALIRVDVLAITALVEFLYCMNFARLPKGRFQEFANSLKAQADSPIPGADAALGDYVTQTSLEALSAILDRIEARLGNPQWQAL